ncbi:hypothetical protein JCM10908_003397 [Rhodotorula pacifica]|uniref:DUF6534 domain-containing protein n=1 Tax=Rhodotorula pacifica TaxID=1495444 RepID=UPI00317E9EA9
MPGTYGITDVPTYSAPQSDASWAMGPAQAGYLVQILLYGVFLALFLDCYMSGELSRTGPLGRTALTLSLLLNTAYTGVCFYEAYISSVSQDRTWYFLSNADLPFNALPLLAGLSAVVTETALSYRAGKLLPYAWARLAFAVWMTLLIMTVLTGSILGCFVGVVYLHGGTTPVHWTASVAIWLWSSAVADVSISLACAYSLKSRIIGFNRETDSLLRTLIFVVLRTAAYTAIISVAGAVVESIYKDHQLQSFVGDALWLPTPALYGIALFTFSVSSRRLIDSRLGVVDLHPPPIVERKPIPAPPAAASHRSIRYPILARLSPARSSDISTQRTPLIVTVHQHREIRVEEDVDCQDSVEKTRFGRARGKDQCATSPV